MIFTTPTITVKGDALATPLGGWLLVFETPAQFSSLEDETPSTTPLNMQMFYCDPPDLEDIICFGECLGGERLLALGSRSLRVDTWGEPPPDFCVVVPTSLGPPVAVCIQETRTCAATSFRTPASGVHDMVCDFQAYTARR